MNNNKLIEPKILLKDPWLINAVPEDYLFWSRKSPMTLPIYIQGSFYCVEPLATDFMSDIWETLTMIGFRRSDILNGTSLPSTSTNPIQQYQILVVILINSSVHTPFADFGGKISSLFVILDTVQGRYLAGNERGSL